mgnify:CR=1 FL=1
MNYKDIQPIDSRPKRRKSRDNPYTLFTVGMWEGSPRYYISFRTTNGDSICLEIAQEVYKEMDQFELDDLRYLNEVDNHYEHSALTEETLSKRTAYRPEGIEDAERVFERVYCNASADSTQKIDIILLR